MPALTKKTNVTKNLPAHFLGPKAKRKISNTKGIKRDVELDNKKRLNKKMSQRDQINRNGTKRGGTPKPQSIPIIDFEVRDVSPPALASTLVVTGKGFRAPRKSPSKKIQNKTIGDARELDKLHKETSVPQEPIPAVYTDNWISGFEERTPSPVMDPESRTSTPTECLSEPVEATNQKITSTNVDYTVTRPKEPTNLKKGYGISLDMVELWEGESDNESGSRDDKFDSINGVIINPRKTIDFSELRRFRLKEAVDVDEKTEEDNDKSKRGSSKKTKRAKPKVMMTKNMKALLTFPPASPRSTDCPTNVTFGKYYRNLKSSERETRKEEHQQHQQQRSKLLPILTKPGKKSSGEGTESPSIAKPRSRGSPLLPPKQRQLNVTYDFSDELSSSPKRVNFNNFVTVEDGEMSTLEMLKSSNNSLQLIKQRYLGQERPCNITRHTKSGPPSL